MAFARSTALRCAAGLVSMLAIGAAPVARAQAAVGPVYIQTALSAATSSVVNGTGTVRMSTTIKASTATTVARIDICVRDSAGSNFDFPYGENTVVTTKGTTYTAERSLPVGSYT